MLRKALKYNPSAYSTWSSYMAFKRNANSLSGTCTPINFVFSLDKIREDDKFRIINLKDMDVSKKVDKRCQEWQRWYTE